MPDYAAMLEAAREAVVLASGVCRQVQAALEQVRAITKDDKSPVTVADYASQAIVAHHLSERLSARMGRVQLVGEEASGFLREAEHAPHLSAVLAAVRDAWPSADEGAVLDAIDAGGADAHQHGFWTLDPIDGTKGFLRNQQYAVALAYVEGGVPVVGVLGCPNLPRDLSEPMDVPDPEGCLYFTIRGQGVYESSAGDATAEAVRITRLDHGAGEEICITGSVESAHTNLSDEDRMLQWLRDARGEEIGETVRLDSQCKYAVVARGQADAYLRLPTKKGYVERIWDHAAGALIAAEAGAAVTDIHGSPLDFSRGRGLEKNRGVVCAPPRLHGLLLAAIAELKIGTS